MKVEYVTNASFLFTLSSGRTLLADPWYGDGIYYGSWYNYPPLAEEQRRRYLGSSPDYIYISHLHPDHLDPSTLARFDRDTPILIGKLPHDHLRRIVASLGFRDIRELPLDRPATVDGFEATILGQFAGTSEGYTDEVDYAMDTSLWIADADGTSVFHAVDNAVKPGDAARIVETLGRPDVAILPYSGASMYPHAFPGYGDAEKAAARDALRARMLDALVDVARAMGARWTVPAAGTYVMGGRIAAYSRYLHTAAPGEVRARWARAGLEPDRLLWMTSGDALDTATGAVSRDPLAVAREFTHDEQAAYALSLAGRPLAQDLVAIPEDFKVPWARLLPKARRNLWAAQTRLGLFPVADVELHVTPTPGVPAAPGEPRLFAFPLDAERPYASAGYERRPDRQVVSFRIDGSLLLMALIGAAVWNNIEIGALVECERQPDVYLPGVHSLMSFFML